MRTATGLMLMAVGAILAFAVTATPPVFNLQIAGWVLITTGLVGIFVPKKGYGWLRRRMVLRPGPRGPVVSQVDETHYPRSLVRFPDGSPPPDAGSVEDAGPVARVWQRGRWVTVNDPLRRQARSQTGVSGPMAPGETETIEEFSEE